MTKVHYDKILLITDTYHLPAIRFNLRRRLVPDCESLHSHIRRRIAMKGIGNLTC